MFVAGVRTIDRVRGGGWLDCPNCHEHASQDVVDEMRFLAMVGYRFTPLGRRRVLVCRRCGHRRPAIEAELSTLSTGGRRIQRAWMLPIGLVPFAVVAVLLIALFSHHAPSIEDVLTFTNDTAQPVAPVGLRRPLSWNAVPESDSTPPAYIVSDPTEQMVFSLRRVTDSTTLEQLLATHYMDDNGINDTGVPQTPPPAIPLEIAGEPGLMIRFTFQSTGQQAQITFYCFFHDGIGYTLDYVAKGAAQFQTLDEVGDTVNRSLMFTATETPAPCPSPSPSPEPSSSAVPRTGATPSPRSSGSSSSSSSGNGAAPTLPPIASSPQPCVGAAATPSPGASPTAKP